MLRKRHRFREILGITRISMDDHNDNRLDIGDASGAYVVVVGGCNKNITR